MHLVVLLIAFLLQGNLTELLRDRDPDVRKNGAILLGKKKERSALYSLYDALLVEQDSSVRQEMMKAIEDIADRKFNGDIEQVKKWWATDGKDYASRTANIDVDEKIKAYETHMNTLVIVSIIVAVLFVAVMIYFVGYVNSKLKEWKEVVKQADTYIQECKNITEKVNRIGDDLESKKISLLELVRKNESQAKEEIERYTEIMQKGMDHHVRIELMELRQRAEKELGQTNFELKAKLDSEIARIVTSAKDKVDRENNEMRAKFLKEVEFYQQYLEATFYAAGGRFEEAIKKYQKVLELNPKHFMSLTNLGGIYKHLMRYDDALATYNRALEASPENPLVYYSIAAIYARMKKKDTMMEYLTKAVNLDGEFKDEALNDVSFKEYWSDQQFRAVAEV